ncbi:MAG: ATP-binding cassette domain-containing protein [Candidatus Protistobacter heckmanni]|nr:ATP-binding cassette domain-containing protein [Candidatus Protistobacter heckmanni]
MSLLTLTRGQLSYAHVALLDQADFSLENGERVGLIGRNGTGKSSLLKILVGESALDGGELTQQSGLTRAVVPQEPRFEPGLSVYEAVASGLPAAQHLAEYNRLADSLADPDADHAAATERMHLLQLQLDAGNGWAAGARIDAVLGRLGLDANAKVDALSGGGLKRVALGQALVREPDVLFLDEPTNHLDIASIRWLEDLLIEYRGSVVLIIHDRAFLDRVCTRIVELDRGQLRSYPGNFAAYQTRKAEELAAEQLANARFDKLLAQEEVWIRKGVEARRTRSVGRVARLKAMREEYAQRRNQQGAAKMEIGQAERSGKLVAELDGVSKSYGARKIVDNFSCTVLRGARIGLIGPNGAGKTTLLKLILGELAPDAGVMRQGSQLQVAYFDQMRAKLDLDLSLADTISPGSEWIEINGKRKHVASYLGDFLFPPQRARSPVSSLSGGERSRLLLARLFAKPANVLVLDEPTNDLDIETLELLEELLQEFAGTVFLVSHDRAFIDSVVTSVIASEGEGRWREHIGGYSDWEQWARTSAEPAKPAQAAAQPKAASPANAASAAGKAQPKGAGLNNKEKRELEGLPERIAALEAEQARIAAELADGQIYIDEAERAAALAERHNAIDEELLTAMGRWEALEAKAQG